MSVNTNELTEALDHLKQAKRLLIRYQTRMEDTFDKAEPLTNQPDMMLADTLSAITRVLLTLKAIGDDGRWAE